MKALVTGGAGFIGSHIVDRLLYEGHSVVVIDNESSDGHNTFYWNELCENHQLDIREYENILRLFNGVDCVFHLAAKASIQSSIDFPLPTISTQVMGTANVLEASRQCGVRKFVYSSTSACYGNNNPIPNVETMREDPLNAYAVGKLSGEQLVRSFCNLYGMETTSFRYTNVYGDRARHVGTYAPVVSKFLKCRREGVPLTIFGDGEQRRDFVHVSDVVHANYIAATVEQDKYGQTFNLGYGNNWSINELAHAVGGEIQYFPARPEMRETLADISKVKELLGWEPKINIIDWINSTI